MFYTGIGSRRTPANVLIQMTKLARILNSHGYTLRSGGADGADLAFEAGAGAQKEIYLPWKGFNGSSSPLWTIEAGAIITAAQHHPTWTNLSPAVQKLMARNAQQITGYDGTLSRFVICWTPGGTGSGGTGQAIRIAKTFNVPVLDLGHGQSPREIADWIESHR